jgi:diaminohydroxyphosphoribosylaminopyrimidine deaminase/5-amino-6-(5-phosphoribosylamino)uracil reductase
MVGINTVLADDPQLTARDVPLRRTAARVVLDTHLKLPPGCRLALTARDVPVLVLASRRGLEQRSRRARQLEQRGVELIPCSLKRGRLDLADVLRRLGSKAMTNLLVEGGGQVLTGFLDRGLADELYAFIAPKLLGGAGAVTPYAGAGTSVSNESGALRHVTSRRVERDLLVQARLATTA